MIRRLTFDIACKHTKFDDSSFTGSREISGGLKFKKASRGPDHAHLGDSWSSATMTNQGWFVMDGLGHAVINLATKYEVLNSVDFSRFLTFS